jgi:hypothetical protein
MKRLKRGGIIALGAILAAVVFCCSFCQPFIPGAVYDAIPAHATFVHKAGNLEEILGSPVCSQIDNALGAGNSIESLLRSNSWVKLAAPSEIAITAIPPRGPGQSKAWAAASWVGWRSPWLRWRLEHTRAEGLSFMGKHAVWPVWIYESSDIARGANLTFALTDKLFLVCLSERSSDILLLLDTYDRRVPSITHSSQKGHP